MLCPFVLGLPKGWTMVASCALHTLPLATKVVGPKNDETTMNNVAEWMSIMKIISPFGPIPCLPSSACISGIKSIVLGTYRQSYKRGPEWKAGSCYGISQPSNFAYLSKSPYFYTNYIREKEKCSSFPVVMLLYKCGENEMNAYIFWGGKCFCMCSLPACLC